MALVLRIAAVLLAACTPALAQTVFEIEPNSLKTEATQVTFTTGIVQLSGTSTGSIVLPGDTSLASVDTYRVKTMPLAPGIYRHSLSLTVNGGLRGHSVSVRGLDQTGTVGVGGVAGTNDVELQTSSGGGYPWVAWYGFGKQEEIYYRVSGIPGATVPYRAWISTSTITPTVITTPLESSNPITIHTTGETNNDTEILLYDSNFTPVPLGTNDDEYLGATTQSRLSRILSPGTYYLAVGFGGLASDQAAAPDDDVVTGGLTDFPDCVVPRFVNSLVDWDFRIVASNGTHIQPNPGFTYVDPLLVTWFQFTTAVGAPVFPPPPVNDACSSATPIVVTSTIFGTLNGATNDATSACDPGGPPARDVWYSFTNPLAVTSVCRMSTCGGGPADTLLAAFAGCGLAELACNDDCGSPSCNPNQSCLTVVLSAGQTVLIRVSDKLLVGNATFAFTLSNAPYTPANDSCATPEPMSSPTFIDNLGATTGPEGQNEALCNLAGLPAIVQDVWYTWTASANGLVTVSTCGGLNSIGSGHDSKIAVYQGAGCPTGPALACSDDSPLSSCWPTEHAWTTFNAVCSETYTIQIGLSPGSTVALLGGFGISGGTGCSSSTDIFCRGDSGGGGTCPCGNFGLYSNGCASSAYSSGARLAGTGIASSTGANDTFVLTAQSVPGPCLFFQSSASTFNSIALGDGRLCAAGSIVRLGVAFPSAGVARLPNALDPTPIHVLGGVTIGTRYYQSWYRSFPGLCGAGPFNLTQGVSVFWAP